MLTEMWKKTTKVMIKNVFNMYWSTKFNLKGQTQLFFPLFIYECSFSIWNHVLKQTI